MTLGEDARARVFAARERRVDRQVANVDRLRNTPRPAAYGGEGRVQRLGADGPWRPGSNQFAGGLPIGGPVGYVAGVASSQPTIGGGAGGDARVVNLEETVRRFAGMFGAILTDVADPNDAEIRPRHNEDILGSTTSGVWLWDSEEGEWVPMPSGLAAPPAQLVAGDPNTLGTTPRGEGTDLAINTSDQSLWYWDTTGEEWVQIAGGGGGSVIYDQGDPNELGIPTEGVAVYFDSQNRRTFFPGNGVWFPTGNRNFYDGEGPGPTAAYNGDLYVDLNGNIWIMRSGSWTLTCGRCDDDPPEPPIPPAGPCPGLGPLLCLDPPCQPGLGDFTCYS